MVSTFKENVPATNSSLQSSEIRENFAALYDKVKALEVQETSPLGTSILVLGGPIYFRASTTQQLRLIRFNTKIFDIANSFGYKTRKDGYGSLYRELQPFKGPSSFEAEGLLLEILISLSSNGQLNFTESLVGQNNQLSSPFNIYFDDSEIPLALIILEKTGEGQLLPIQQENITDVRPFVTTSFQNNQQTADLEATVGDNTTRINSIESSLRITDALLGRLPPTAKLQADLTTTTNTKIEILSGIARSGNSGASGSLKFAGATVDFSLSAVSSGRNIAAGTPATTGDWWRKALISLQYDSLSVDPTENAILVVTHGVSAIAPDQVGEPVSPSMTVPLTKVLYRMKSDATNIRPLISLIDIDGFRLNHEFTITDLQSVPSSSEAFGTLKADLSGTGFNQSTVETILFQVGDAVEIFDDNTRSVRRTISSVSFNITTNIVTISVTDSFVEISLLRNPKVRSISQNLNILEDTRPFIGID